MELAFNVLWILLTVAALGLWRARGIHTKPGLGPRHFRMFIGAVAVGCAVTFLFPAVSLTDDLRCEQPSGAKLSDLDITAHKWRPWRDSHTKWESPPAATIFGFSFTSPDAFQAILDPPEKPGAFLTFWGPTQDRAPPLISALS